MGAAVRATLTMVLWVPMVSGVILLPTVFDPVLWRARRLGVPVSRRRQVLAQAPFMAL